MESPHIDGYFKKIAQTHKGGKAHDTKPFSFGKSQQQSNYSAKHTYSIVSLQTEHRFLFLTITKTFKRHFQLNYIEVCEI